jgi:hypothetical protein
MKINLTSGCFITNYYEAKFLKCLFQKRYVKTNFNDKKDVGAKHLPQ